MRAALVAFTAAALFLAGVAIGGAGLGAEPEAPVAIELVDRTGEGEPAQTPTVTPSPSPPVDEIEEVPREVEEWDDHSGPGGGGDEDGDEDTSGPGGGGDDDGDSSGPGSGDDDSGSGSDNSGPGSDNSGPGSDDSGSGSSGSGSSGSG
jgi:hypothetical protein